MSEQNEMLIEFEQAYCDTYGHYPKPDSYDKSNSTAAATGR